MTKRIAGLALLLVAAVLVVPWEGGEIEGDDGFSVEKCYG